MKKKEEYIEALETQEKKFEDAIVKAETTQINRSQFWAKISHELRTPLNVIIGMAEISKDEIYDIDKVRYGMDRIEEASRALLELVNNIIDYSAIETGSIPISHNKFNLKEMITNLTILHYQRAKEKQQHFDIHVEGVTEEIIIGDEKRFNQVLHTLLDTVINHTPQDGKIDFSVIQTSTSKNTVHMRFVIRTTGAGMGEKMLEQLQLPFTRAAMNAYAQKEDESGIAMFIVRYLIEQMGGRIEASNLGGEGCELILDLSFEDEADAAAEKEFNIFDEERILMIADGTMQYQEKGKMLESIGMHYDIAYDKDQALNMIGEAENSGKPYCMCVLDWYAQKEETMDLIHDIRSIFGQDIVIVATAYNAGEKVEKAQMLGVNYVIEKTWFRSTLFDAMMKIKKGEKAKQELKSIRNLKYNFDGKRVLVAEDINLNMEVIVKLLSKVNANVVCVENGLEAVGTFERKPAGYFDIILMDVNMPVMDGYEATRQIRSSDKRDAKSIPIYAMTANAFTEDIADAMKAGMNGHIAKPVETEILYQTLEKVFEQDVDKYGNNLKNQAEVLQKQNEELREKAEHDPLTGLLNRYAFEKIISELLTKRQPLGFVLVDLDKFKDVNDLYGHETGDKMLIKTAQLLKEEFDEKNYVIRFGGDEFAILLNGYPDDKNFIYKKIENINQALACAEDGLPAASVSAGAVFSEDGYTKNLYQLADKALYFIKNNGRSGCQVYSEKEGNQFEKIASTLYNRSWYGESMFYVKGDNGIEINQRQSYLDLILQNNKAVGVVSGYFDEGFSIYSISGFALKNLGYNYQEFIETTGGKFYKAIYEEDRKNFLVDVKDGVVSKKKIRLRHKNGEIIWFDEADIATKTVEGKQLWICSFRHIDDYLVGNLCDEDYVLVGIIDWKQDTFMIEKEVETYHFLNLKRKRQYNYSGLIELFASNSCFITGENDISQKLCLQTVKKKLDRNGIYEVVSYYRTQNGEYRAIRSKFRYLKENHDLILCTQEIVDQWAANDELTDLLNKYGFYQQVAEILQKDRTGQRYEILYFDIKAFKAINENLGTEGANKLLKQFAQQLQSSTLCPEAACRLMADHFVCMIRKENLSYEEITRLCGVDFVVEGRSVTMRLNCGVYEINDPSMDVRTMCDMAKLAKGYVTNEFAVPYAVFDADMNEQYRQKIHIIDNLGRALEKQELQVYYQPVFDTKTRKICSAEALIRWIYPGGIVIAPGKFVPALEEKGYIAELDFYVENQTQKFLEARKQNGKEIVPISMNLSRMDFYNDKFLTKLAEQVKNAQVDTDYLRFEITESAYMDIESKGIKLLKELRKWNSKLYLDDFGTGYSSLENLVIMGFDYLKVDMKFIQEIGKNPVAESIIHSLIETCHSVGVSVVAEGVETKEQYEFLLKNECDYVQGFYFSKPLPKEEFAALLDRSFSSEGERV